MLRTPLLLTLLLTLLLPLAACGDSAEAKELRGSAGQALSDLKDYASTQRDAFLEAVDERLAAADVDLDALKEAGSRTADDVSARTAELRKQVEARLAELKKASGEGWDAARDRLIDALDELETALREER